MFVPSEILLITLHTFILLMTILIFINSGILIYPVINAYNPLSQFPVISLITGTTIKIIYEKTTSIHSYRCGLVFFHNM